MSRSYSEQVDKIMDLISGQMNFSQEEHEELLSREVKYLRHCGILNQCLCGMDSKGWTILYEAVINCSTLRQGK